MLAGISQDRLAREAGINVITVRRMELARDGAIPFRRYSIDAVRRALEGAGVVFGEDGWADAVGRYRGEAVGRHGS